MNSHKVSFSNVANLLPVFAASIQAIDSKFAAANDINKNAIIKLLKGSSEQIRHICSNQQNEKWLFDAGHVVSKSIQEVKLVVSKIEDAEDCSAQASAQQLVMSELLNAIAKM